MYRISNLFAMAVMALLPHLGVCQCGDMGVGQDTMWVYSLPWYGNNAWFSQQGWATEDSLSASPARICNGGTNPSTFRVPVRCIILHNSDSTGGYPEDSVELLIKSCNALHEQNQTRIALYRACEIVHVFDDFFNTQIAKEEHWDSLFRMFDHAIGMDLFFVDTMIVENYGVGKYPVAGPQMRMHALVRHRGRRIEELESTFIHEIAHCFNLAHTAAVRGLGEGNVWANKCQQESVSRSRTQGLFCHLPGTLKCETNGDFLCDTDADPTVHRGLGSLNGCAYVAVQGQEEDQWGDLWTPDPTNLMALTDTCRSTFTSMQRTVMQYTVMSYIPGYFPVAENDFDLYEPDAYPLTATLIGSGDQQHHTFHWIPVTASQYESCDADWYRIEVTTLGAIDLQTHRVLYQPVPDTYLELFDEQMNLLAANNNGPLPPFSRINQVNLAPGTYFAKVSNLSSYPSDSSRGHYLMSLNMGPPTDYLDPHLRGFTFSAYPNPAIEYLEVNVEVPSGTKLTASMVDAMGRVVFSESFSATQSHPFRVDVSSLPPSVYTLLLQTGRSFASKAILISR